MQEDRTTQGLTQEPDRSTHGIANDTAALYFPDRDEATDRTTLGLGSSAGRTYLGILRDMPFPIHDFLFKRLYFIGRKQIGKKVILRYVARGQSIKHGSRCGPGRQDIYPYVVPHNPRTELQQANRMKFQAAMAAWKLLTPEERAPWEQKAAMKGIYGKNLFVKDYMLNHP